MEILRLSLPKRNEKIAATETPGACQFEGKKSAKHVGIDSVGSLLECRRDCDGPAGVFGVGGDGAEHAKQALSRLAEKTFRTRKSGPVRMDAVMYCLGALKKFHRMPLTKVKAIAFEIGLLGTTGLDTSDPTPKYTLKSLTGDFSGLHLSCLMYVAFQMIDSSVNIGFDLSKEYETAQLLFKPNS